jgi:hypothetical protein
VGLCRMKTRVEGGISKQSDAEGSREYRCMPSLKVVSRYVVAIP